MLAQTLCVPGVLDEKTATLLHPYVYIVFPNISAELKCCIYCIKTVAQGHSSHMKTWLIAEHPKKSLLGGASGLESPVWDGGPCTLRRAGGHLPAPASCPYLSTPGPEPSHDRRRESPEPPCVLTRSRGESRHPRSSICCSHSVPPRGLIVSLSRLPVSWGQGPVAVSLCLSPR